MYKGFNLKLNEDFFYNITKHYSVGARLYNKDKAIVEKNLDNFILKNTTTLDGSSIQKNWFPDIESEIFISHSHKDEDIAILLSGWLYDNFGLKSFIDSCIWGYSDDLLQIIDNKYCISDYGFTYDYKKRNYSTSHVHMMLSTALNMMIDKTECLLFLNTPNSLNTYDVITNKTASPWIYSELSISKIIEKKIPLRKTKMKYAHESSLKIEYDVSLNHLADINHETLNRWLYSYSNNKIEILKNALDTLYHINNYVIIN